ncbi:MAG TPA: VWA domain-containing protein [Novimethylophilus sp.]|uniref:VWA domain-containing protein n=1 Tax=Novimethylophilus sp. TaxID=2137426 RepID=UPI002F412DDB
MSFAWPWCFLALPLPWLVRRLLPPVDSAMALRVPSLPAIGGARPETPAGMALWIAVLAWLLLVIAAARPQLPADAALQPASGRDLMLAFDVSASMATADLRLGRRSVTRLDAARALADDFLRQRQGDRVGLIVFGTQAYLHTPLTFDLAAMHAALATMEAGFAGAETALGDAVALAVKRLQPLAEHDHVLVVLTDGVNTAGTLPPLRAAWLARRAGVRIHVIGIGSASSPAGKPERGQADGVDATTLREMAHQTGGIYLRATDSAAIGDFFHQLDRIEPMARGAAFIRPVRELYAWPLAAALALTCWLTLRRTKTAAA